MDPQPPQAVERATDPRPAGRGENIELVKSRQTRSSFLIFRLWWFSCGGLRDAWRLILQGGAVRS
jgi:hypothetical protein